MRANRGRTVVVASAALTIAALLGGAWAIRRPLEEAWLLRQLERGGSEERDRAARRLADLGSVRAIPPLFRQFDRENPWEAEPANFNRLVWIVEEFRSVPVLAEIFGKQAVFQALTEIAAAEGRAATPYLREEVDRRNLWASYLALRLIGDVGAPDDATVSVVRRASEHESPAIRKTAGDVLERLARRRRRGETPGARAARVN